MKRRAGNKDIEDDEEDGEEDTCDDIVAEYRRRDVCRAIRFRNYDIGDLNNFKREMAVSYTHLYCREYRQRKRVLTTQEASDEPGSSMDVDFVADEMESAMEVDPDPSDPLGIPNMAAGAQNWTCTGADNYFKKTFLYNDFGHKCDICNRLCFKNDLKPTNRSITGVLREEFPSEEVSGFKLCNNCKAQCSKGRIPALSRSNGCLLYTSRCV